MLYHYHSNSLQLLAESLIQQSAPTTGEVLQQQVILVQNPGMKRWLQQHVSLTTGVAANIDFPLPSRFIWDIFLAEFEDGERISYYDASNLRWRLMALLGRHADDEELKLLAAYLANDPRDITRFQLAERLASLFDQYQVYRPQMLVSWDQGNPARSATEQWQQYLWRKLSRQAQGSHRGELISRLINRLDEDELHSSALPSRLHVFGLSALSPLYLNVLLALGQHIDVLVYHLNPCQYYWGDIESRREALNRGDGLASDNELLASLGQQGREFIDLFYDHGFEFEEFHQFQAIQPRNLLQRIQHDILNLQQEQQVQDYAGDTSIQIVSCYSELRELQVLQDRLLDLLANDASLQAHDIVVMSPDINELAPYIEAVFGSVNDNRRLPFSISDHNPLQDCALVQAIVDWLSLPGSRFSANEISAWLELPALQRAYGLQAQDLETIRYWIRNNHIHWGLDARFKQQRGLGDQDLNTWQFGIQRLLTSYLLNDRVEVYANRVASDVLMSQSDIETLGALQRLLDDLAGWGVQLSSKATPAQWQQRFNSLIDTLLDLDDDEEWIIKPLRDEVAAWQQQASIAAFDEALDSSVLIQLLQNAIAAGSAHHQYLTGGINFCNLIPMRSLPFRIVCLIGLGSEKFPRKETPAQFDLIGQHPKKGDRSRREDDRYMFLQSLLSAQQTLYLSYVGQNIKDDSVIQPSIVVNELVDYIELNTGYELPVQQTPLQPFSAQNFEQGSYAHNWLISADQPNHDEVGHSIEPPPVAQSLSLADLIEFYRNPTRYFMKYRLNMALHEFEQGIEDDEVFTLGPLSRYQLRQGMLHDLVQHQSSGSDKYLHSGQLAEGSLGVLQYQQQMQEVEALYQALAEHEQYDGEYFHSCQLELSEWTLSGKVPSYSERGLLKLNHGKLGGRHLFELWIQHNFLCACGQPEFTRIVYRNGNRGLKWSGLQKLSATDATGNLQDLVDGFLSGQATALPFYVDTAYQFVSKKAERDEQYALAQIQDQWRGDAFFPLYEAQDSYIRANLGSRGQQQAPFSEEFFQLSSRFMQPLLDALEEPV